MSLILPSPRAKLQKRQPRNWPKYNEKLVQRGDLTFYLEALETWTEDLAIINHDKSGHKFKFPPVLFFVAWILRLMYRLTYRMLAGLFRTLGKQLDFPAPHYSTLQKRMKEISLQEWLPQKMLTGDLIVAVDASGIKIDNYSDWMRHKWHEKAKTRRGWIKIHLIVDTSTHTIIDVKITKEDCGDQEQFIPLMQSALKQELKIKRGLGDGNYDDKKIFTFLHQNRIQPGIPPRKNASRKARGCVTRAKEVEFYQDYGENAWKETRDYRKRPAVERTFSAFKQVFDDRIKARNWENIYKELTNEVYLFNWNLNRPVRFNPQLHRRNLTKK